MRVKKISALALIVAAAGLSLTACDSTGSNASATLNTSTATAGSTGAQSAKSDSSSSASSSSGSSSSGSSSKGSGTGAQLAAKSATTSSAMCKTDNLAFSVSGAMAEDEILVNLRNNGSSTCSMHGFPGLDLMGSSGTAIAARADVSPSTVTLAPGEETESKSVDLSDDLAITIAAPGNESPDVYVYPVGYGK